MKHVDWHSKEKDEVLISLNTNLDGLTTKEVIKRQKENGYNELPLKKPHSFIYIFMLQFVNPMIIVLIFASIASLLIKEPIDAFFIIAIVLLNSFLGAFQEKKAEKSALELQNMIKNTVKVKRNNKEIEIDSKDLVIGDIIMLESGDKIAADIRLIESKNLTVDEAFITGESVAYVKQIEAIDINTQINERSNICFAGSSILTGRAIGVVVEVGLNTEVGKLAEKIISTKSTKAPLVIRMEKFTKQITYFVLILSIFISILLYFNGYIIKEIFLFVVALAVSVIPEGLPVALTVALSVATSRMAKRNVIVRKLTAVESLGSCTVIASDKTGTLTLNKQTVREVILPDNTKFEITGEGYNDIGEIKLKYKSELKEEYKKELEFLTKISVLTNEGYLNLEDKKWVYHGDYMDVALLSFGYKQKIDHLKLKDQHEIKDIIPYESENKYSAVLYKKDDKTYIGLKGAVETILSFCKYQKTIEGTKQIDKNQIEKQALTLAQSGYRVLAIAYKEESNNYDFGKKLEKMVFLGLVGFLDPIRSEVKDAIQICKNAGIRVLMLTGDHPITAKKIAKDMNLIHKEEIITGDILEEVYRKGEKFFDEFVKDKTVFARITPIQKLQIVESLTRQGEFVAVTGDGVNDAPALKKANIGVAMGSGTDVAKETSSMIIVDDKFLSIVAGVEEGRFAYDNVRKVIWVLLSTGFAELIIFILSIIFKLPLPLIAVQILWLNLITNGIQDVALAFEAGEPGAMTKKPRKPNEKIFNNLMLNQTLVSGITIGIIVFGFWVYLINVIKIDEYSARNYVMLLMVFMQNIHTINCRSELTSAFKIPLKNNYILVIGILGALLLHLFSINIPFMQNALKTSSISLEEMFYILLLALPLLFVIEIYKKIKRKNMI